MNPDTETTSPSSETPKLFRFFTDLPKRTQYLFATLFVVSVLGAAYFIGSANYYRVEPLPMAVELPTFELSPFTEKDYYFQILTDEEVAALQTRIGNAAPGKCTEPVPENENYGSDDNEIVEEFNWHGSIVDAKVCQYVSANGPGVIKHLTAAKDVRDGLIIYGIVTIDNVVYIVHVGVRPHYETGQDEFWTGTSRLKDAKSVSALEIINVQGNTLLNIKGIDGRGSEFDRYLGIYYSIHGSGFSEAVVRLPDGTFEQRFKFIPRPDYEYHADLPSVSFSTPSPAMFNGPGAGDRYTSYPNPPTSVIYHPAACSMEDSYADLSFSSGTRGQGINIYINQGAQQVLNITTARTGYNPEDWGKILRTVSLESFKESVRANKAHNSDAPVTMKSLGGYSVKFIGPLKDCLGRATQERKVYQYQAVRGAEVVTIHFTSPGYWSDTEPRPFRESEADALVARVLETLIITPQ